jgi:phage terminase small subunit
MHRHEPVTLTPPDWLLADLAALAVWQQIMKDAGGFEELLDNLDSRALATFCKLCALEDQAVRANDAEQIAKLARVRLPYAEKLGLTPVSRARLAKKKTDKKDDPNAKFFE